MFVDTNWGHGGGRPVPFRPPQTSSRVEKVIFGLMVAPLYPFIFSLAIAVSALMEGRNSMTEWALDAAVIAAVVECVGVYLALHYVRSFRKP